MKERDKADRLEALLFDLAPDGVCRAVFITEAAVGSYPTFSPLPQEALRPLAAVYSLLHFP